MINDFNFWTIAKVMYKNFSIVILYPYKYFRDEKYIVHLILRFEFFKACLTPSTGSTPLGDFTFINLLPQQKKLLFHFESK